jgi:hypothetical protein
MSVHCANLGRQWGGLASGTVTERDVHYPVKFPGLDFAVFVFGYFADVLCPRGADWDEEFPGAF